MPGSCGRRSGTSRCCGGSARCTELAVGFGLAQQMIKDGFAGGHAMPSVAPASPAGIPPIPTGGGAGLPELLSPAEAAQALGVTEADVMAVLDSGDLKGKKIGTSWRISRAALTTYMTQ